MNPCRRCDIARGRAQQPWTPTTGGGASGGKLTCEWCAEKSAPHTVFYFQREKEIELYTGMWHQIFRKRSGQFGQREEWFLLFWQTFADATAHRYYLNLPGFVEKEFWGEHRCLRY